jgi:hypothetical protein
MGERVTCVTNGGFMWLCGMCEARGHEDAAHHAGMGFAL